MTEPGCYFKFTVIFKDELWKSNLNLRNILYICSVLSKGFIPSLVLVIHNMHPVILLWNTREYMNDL